MADGKVVIEFGAEEAKYMAALAEAARGLAKVEGGASKVAEETRKAAREEAELGRQAKQVLQDIATPQDRYNAQLERLNNLLAHNKLTDGQYASAVDKVKKEYEKAGASGMEAFGPKAVSMVGTLAGALGIGLGLAGVLQKVKEEFDAVKQSRDRALNATMNVAEAEANFIRNIGPEERDEGLKRIQDLSKKTGVSEKDLYIRTSEALSARGDMPLSAVFDSVEVSTRLARNADEGKAIASAGLDIAKFTGATPEQSIGYLMKIGETAHVSSTEKIAENLAPAMRAAMATGASLPAAGAGWSAFTQGINDSEGRVSSNAFINFATQLEKYLPAEGVQYSEEEYQSDRQALSRQRKADEQRLQRTAIHDPEYLETIAQIDAEKAALPRLKFGADPALHAVQESKKRNLADRARQALEESQARVGQSTEFRNLEADYALKENALTEHRNSAKSIVASGFRTYDERLAYLQSHPEAQKDFLGKASFEAKADIPVRELISGNGSTANVERHIRGMLPKDVAAGSEAARRYYDALKTPRQVTATLSQSIGADVDRMNSSAAFQGRAATAVLDKEFENILIDSGEMAFVAQAKKIGGRMTGNMLQGLRDSIEKRSQQLEGPHMVNVNPGFSGGFSTGGLVQVPRAMTDEEKLESETLRNIVHRIDEWMNSMKGFSNASGKLNTAADKLNRSNQSRPTLGRPDQTN